ncbi:MAG TPA: hypothetical protein VLH15_06760 [Dehalococcoidales bacterium]|nr:hypothetical protein [Dehalococcoidales bacterium]
MADQLLSQSDVDALIASLSQNTGNKPDAPASKPAAAASSPVKPPASIPVSRSTVSQTPAVSAPVSHTPVVPTPPASKPMPRAVSVPAKAEANRGNDNALDSRVGEISRQLAELSAAVKKFELMEKRLSELEAKYTRGPAPVKAEQMVQQLAEEMKKIVNNLKGTPGYGVRHKFSCERCDDHGHVAVQFRCTKCGHERWYGWWPDKK